ncbi:hypothetical protein BAU18_002061 [Enterococcus diestrammenae]|uniref:Uncharacterized protein n=1 Tax=Enterococcus diestrammenae TaxID=1155073 RepID=A0ABV0F770_9ENTE
MSITKYIKCTDENTSKSIIQHAYQDSWIQLIPFDKKTKKTPRSTS